jgi:hypothetical protein
MNLIGGLFFGFIPLLTLITGLGKILPGSVILPLSIGALISSISHYKSPELLKTIRKTITKAKIKTVLEILPICANCKKIKNFEGNWQPLEDFLAENVNLTFSHGICDQCLKELYPNYQE